MMLNQAAQLEGEAGENIRRLQDFIMKDKIVVAVSETLNSVAERTGAKGVRELNKKDVPWSLTKEHIEFLDGKFKSSEAKNNLVEAEKNRLYRENIELKELIGTMRGKLKRGKR
jgi:GTPase SAR1 family protein